MRTLRSKHLALWASLLLVMVAGCAAEAPCEYCIVSEDLQTRTGQGPAAEVPPKEILIPPGVVLEDGLSEDEAIATALTNNATFQAALMRLRAIGGDFVQAGLILNPQVTTFLPVDVKQWEFTVFVLPIDFLLLRKMRVDAADKEYQRVAHEVVQTGLDLVRDVRLSFTNLGLAEDQRKLAVWAVDVRREVLELTEKRLDAGDISELEVMTSRTELAQAKADEALRSQDVLVAQADLATVMGVPSLGERLKVLTLSRPIVKDYDVNALIGEALRSRPDLQAAVWAAEAAIERAGISRWAFLRIDAGGDYNDRGFEGPEAGPSLRFDVPIFNRNQGGIIRADAEVRQALYTGDAIRNQIVREVRTAVARLHTAKANLEVLETKAIPPAKEGIEIAVKSFQEGGDTYLLVLQATQQYLTASARVLVELAGLNTSLAELERAVGHTLRQPSHLPGGTHP